MEAKELREHLSDFVIKTLNNPAASADKVNAAAAIALGLIQY